MKPLLFGCCLFWAVLVSAADHPQAFNGAWRPADAEAEAGERVLLVQDGYWSFTHYDREAQVFHRTFGGPFQVDGGRARGRYHFDSAQPGRVGERFEIGVELEDDRLVIDYGDGQRERWERERGETDALAGVWRITARDQGGRLQPMPLRARRTLKLLSGGRFQWIAMNIETGEFAGTGGGTYTFEDGVYVEEIDFFSRDGSRVGARLEFQGEVREGQWHHRGRSSRGDPIYEIWSPLEPEGHDR